MIIKADDLGNGKGPPCRSEKPLPRNRLSLYCNYSAFFQNRKPLFETLSGRYYHILWQPFMMPDEKIIYRAVGDWGGQADGC